MSTLYADHEHRTAPRRHIESRHPAGRGTETGARTPGRPAGQVPVVTRTIDGVEAPMPGRWTIVGVSPDPRQAAPRLSGHLDVGEALAGSRIVLATETAAKAPLAIELSARYARSDGRGDWQFEGVAAIDGWRTRVTVHVRYHGVYRNGRRVTAWLGISVEVVPARGRTHRHGLRRTSTTRPSRLFEADINAELWAPTSHGEPFGVSVRS